MRVAFIGHKQIPSRSGGVEVVVSELAPRVAQFGYDVVAYNRKLKSRRSPESYKGVRLVDVVAPRVRGVEALIYSYVATARAIINGVDVVHYHAIGPSGACWLAKTARKRVVVTVHGLNYQGAKWGKLASLYLRLSERIALRFADEVIVLSNTVKRLYSTKYQRDVHVIPNGISVPEGVHDPKVLDRYHLSERGYVVSVCRIVPGKGLEELLSAFSRTTSGLKLVLVGSDGDMPAYGDQLRSKYEDNQNILFVGQVDRDEVFALLSSARLFVSASHAEGMSMSVLEAMAHDCPVLVSDIPENIELVGGAGRAFAVGDESALFEALQNVFAEEYVSPDTSRTVRAKFDWEKIAATTVALYGTSSGF